MKLTGAQLNHLRATLLISEERMDKIIGLCKTNEKKGILYCIKNNLSEQENKQVKNGIIGMKMVIKQLAKDLNLERQENNTRRIIGSFLSLLWEDLYSATSKELNCYGTVDESTRIELDPIISRLIKTCDKMIRDFRNA